MKQLDAKIVDLLIQPEHLDTAFDIVEQLKVVQDKLQAKFWHTLEQAIRSKISAKEFDICREGAPTAVDAHIAIRDKRAANNTLSCEFAVQQEGGRAPVYFGISWNEEVSKDRSASLMANPSIKPVLATLQTSLAEAGFKVLPPWWLGWKYMNDGQGLRERSLAMILASGNDFEERVFGELQGLIEEQLTAVRELNGVLGKIKE